jgi:hypothetical protein
MLVTIPDKLNLLILHDLLELSPHLSHLPHGLAVDEVVSTPLGRVSVGLQKFKLRAQCQNNPNIAYLNMLKRALRVPITNR